jgi:hypothetical protein
LFYTFSVSQYLGTPPEKSVWANQPLRLYIASNLVNAEKVLPHWTRSFNRLLDLVGQENVFLSILEGGSVDNTRTLLQDFDQSLPANFSRSIVLNGESKQDVLNDPSRTSGWIYPYANTKRPMIARRIPFLAEQRDRLLDPLRIMGEQGITFDKVIIMNDIFYEVGFLHPFTRLPRANPCG